MKSLKLKPMQPRLMFVNTTTKALTKSANSVLWSTTTKHVHLTYHVKMWQLKCGTSKSDFFKSIVRIANSSNVHISTALVKILSQLRMKKKKKEKNIFGTLKKLCASWWWTSAGASKNNNAKVNLNNADKENTKKNMMKHSSRSKKSRWKTLEWIKKTFFLNYFGPKKRTHI